MSEFRLGMSVRVLPVGSVVLRGVVLSPGLVPGVLRGVVPSPGVLRDVVPSPGLVPGVSRDVVPSPGVLLGVVPSPGVVLPGGRWVGIRPSGVPGVRPSGVPGVVRPSGAPGTRPSPVPEKRSPAPPETRPSAVADADAVVVLRGVDGDVGLGVEAGPGPVEEAVPEGVAEVALAAPELDVGLLGLAPDDVLLPDVPPL